MTYKKNDFLECEIIDLGDSGEGIGKIDGITVFIKGAVIGDFVKAKVIKVKKQYLVAKLEDVITPSQIRTQPFCEYFPKCGGCQIQNIKYHEQLNIKKNHVNQVLNRIGKLKDYKLNDTVGMDIPRHFRNKGSYPIREQKIGFYKQGTHHCIDIRHCAIQDEANGQIINKIRDIIIERNISSYDEKKHTGYLRHVLIRTNKNGDRMIVFVTNSEKAKKLNPLVDILKEDSKTVSIIQNVNLDRTNRILGFRNNTLYGQDTLTDWIDTLEFEISPLSFFQVNRIQTQTLYSKALEYADLNGDETVFDLYCGIGTISLFLAQKAKKVIGVEIVEAAIEDARRNAKANSLDNTEFHVGKAEDVIPKLYKDGYKADVVVVDPPRKGCDESLLKTIADMNPKKIVYVSCKASTLARDLKILEELGYKTEEVTPVDMFPHSTHVETVVKLKLSL